MTINQKERNEAIKLTIKLYPHKFGDELAMEIIDYLDRIENKKEDNIHFIKNDLQSLMKVAKEIVKDESKIKRKN